MDTSTEHLSKSIHEVLDFIGASEKYRKKSRECAMFIEIALTYECQIYGEKSNPWSAYVFGSRSEGTSTPALASDIDCLCCLEAIPVVDNLEESLQRDCSYLILTDDTKPGYVRLQLVAYNRPLSVDIPFDLSQQRNITIDPKGRLCHDHPSFVSIESYRSGPADTLPASPAYSSCAKDFVCAYRGRQIPRSAQSWLDRKRKYDWPSKKQLTIMGSSGCFFVGVGHPHSNNRNIEWRISFSLQEREIMFSLNETQHKCYILLKIIKKDIIASKHTESISSYHCKTSLFYTMENSPSHFWTDDKLIICVQHCLIRLLIWVKANNCPNYFIPEENMFDKLSPKALSEIGNVLNTIIHSGFKFLYTLTCDNVGELLKSKMRGCSLRNACSLYGIYRNHALIVNNARNEYLRRLHESSNTHTCYFEETKKLLLMLQSTSPITEHTSRDKRMTLDFIIPHIQLQYQQCMFAQYLTRADEFRQRSKTIPSEIPEASDCDLISSKLSLASLYLQSGQRNEECKRILVSCEKSLKPHVISVCDCNYHRRICNIITEEQLRNTDMSSKYFERNYITGCMVFNSCQVSLVPEALRYELFRNVYTQRGTDHETNVGYWLNFITVDSQVYLYFLQYLLFSESNKLAEKETTLKRLILAVKRNPNLGHRDTAFNLLGWIYVQNNDLRSAWGFFCDSWNIRPFKNAAKWHIAVLLSTLYIRK